MTDQVQTLAMAAALSRTLSRVLDELDEATVGEEAREAVRGLADRLESAIDARAGE